ncbi:TonB-dependent receptor [Temperatibacter marinus]|uniref:TonB-dependent receptor n=1 Tax=Temperatibacter marinus TaxID=1456591 RepID=A0AA52H9J4_9PROT|nr:TonB-dependent receptor [Temperatibacter marinus]WND02979.1 TonB-dependent receptor [Temperatibacter marinus]
MSVSNQIKSRRMCVALLSTTAMTLSAGSAVVAQDEEFTLEEIVVTATRRSQSVQDIPYNISAVGGDAIDKAIMTDSTELLRSIPGIVSPDRGTRNAATLNSIRIRGLNVDGAARGDYAASSAPTVATYINDTPIFTNLMLVDLDRVEVLRGPQGTLYGSGALGGAVRYITKKPQFDEFSGYVQGKISKSDGSGGANWSSDLVLNIPFSDSFAIRAVASHIDNAGIIDYTNVYALDSNMAPVLPSGGLSSTDAVFTSVKDADSSEVDFLRITALAELSETVDISLMYSHQEDSAAARRATAEGYYNTAYGSLQQYGEYEAGSVQLEPSQATTDLISAEVNVDLGFATLTSSTSYYEVDGSAISENTGFYAQKGWIANLYYNHPRPLARADRRFGDKAFVQELRLVSNNEGPLNYVVGAYYQDQDKSIGQTSTLAGYSAWAMENFGWMSEGFGYDANDNDFIFDDVQKVSEKAVFGELTYDVSEDLHVTAGIRYFDSDVESDAIVQLPFWDSLASWQAARTQTSSGKKDALFKLNVSYDVSDEMMVYGTISEGYRRGGAASVPTTGNFAEDPAWLSYESDSVVNYEFGVKGQTDTLRYTASVFYVDWSNPQINTATANWGFFTVANGDKASTKGLELEVEAQLSENLNLTAGYAFVDASLTEDFVAPTGAYSIAHAGDRTPGTPKHVFNIVANYTTEISGVETLFRLDGYIQSKSHNYINNDHATYGRYHAGFGVWNGNVTFDLEPFDVSLFVKNITNEEGVTANFSATYMGHSAQQNYYGNGAKREITLPRTVGVAVRYSF